jgi:8-oxo-dGTP pyrophosphatase MutT (NUDIX family)
MAKKRAGVVPFYVGDDDQIHMMFMRPSNPKFGGHEFQVAKGVVEEDEEYYEAALREGFEELGLQRSNIHAGRIYQLPGDDTNPGSGCYLYTIKIYAVGVKSMDDAEFAPFSHETGATTWMTLKEYQATGRELMSPIVEDVVALVENINLRAGETTRTAYEEYQQGA